MDFFNVLFVCLLSTITLVWTDVKIKYWLIDRLNSWTLCVYPTGNITLDVRMFFGVYPDPDLRGPSDSQRTGPSAASDYNRWLPNVPGKYRSSLRDGDDSMGMYAETIYYETDDAIGYVTVTAPTCNFVDEMTYGTLDNGGKFGPYIWNSLPRDLRHCSTKDIR